MEDQQYIDRVSGLTEENEEKMLMEVETKAMDSLADDKQALRNAINSWRDNQGSREMSLENATNYQGLIVEQITIGLLLKNKNNITKDSISNVADEAVGALHHQKIHEGYITRLRSLVEKSLE